MVILVTGHSQLLNPCIGLKKLLDTPSPLLNPCISLKEGLDTSSPLWNPLPPPRTGPPTTRLCQSARSGGIEAEEHAHIRTANCLLLGQAGERAFPRNPGGSASWRGCPNSACCTCSPGAGTRERRGNRRMVGFCRNSVQLFPVIKAK